MKVSEPEMSLVCYHSHRGWGRRSVSLFSGYERITIQLIVEPNVVPKGKEAHVPHFTEDSLRRIIINPFYAITVVPQLTEEHEPAMDETEWVRTNVTLIGEMGAASWLRQLLDILES